MAVTNQYRTWIPLIQRQSSSILRIILKFKVRNTWKYGYHTINSLKSIICYQIVQLITDMSGDENGISYFASRKKWNMRILGTSIVDWDSIALNSNLEIGEKSLASESRKFVQSIAIKWKGKHASTLDDFVVGVWKLGWTNPTTVWNKVFFFLFLFLLHFLPSFLLHFLP